MSEWYEKSFGPDYLKIYKHRDSAGAKKEIMQIVSWLGLPEGAHILDLCCGTGRHSFVLADYGYQVTGLDLSEALLAEARRMDTAQRVRWVHGDMRKLPFDSEFDGVVNLFTSFGYFADDRDNEQVFIQIRHALKPGGRYVIDFLNREFVIAQLVPYSEKWVDGLKIEEYRSVQGDYVTKRLVITDQQETRTYKERVKMYTLEQMRRFADNNGLSVQKVMGSAAGDPYERNKSPRMILTGERE